MSRQTLVTALLIIAGIVLAIALFAAGVLWHSRAGSGLNFTQGATKSCTEQLQRTMFQVTFVES
jgi:hypothetical protein